MKTHRIVVWALSMIIFFASSIPMSAQGNIVSKKITLQYIAPADLKDAGILSGDSIHTSSGDVMVRINSSTNEILLWGSENALQAAANMIDFLDVQPKQIVVEVKILELNNQKLQHTGIDWQQILSSTSIPFQYAYNKSSSNTSSNNTTTSSSYSNDPNSTSYQYINGNASSNDGHGSSSNTNFGIANSMRIGDFLHVLENSDGAKILNTPKIVTINNKKGTILDGSRILYVDKYASYSNLFQTQELKTGLYLSVTPTMGASGYVKMNVEAKLTELNNAELRPIEVGQMLENIVVVKAGESIMLGGLKRTTTEKVETSIPVLGSILPFLFSSTKNIEVTNDVLVVLTPTVLDMTKIELPDALNEKK